MGEAVEESRTAVTEHGTWHGLNRGSGGGEVAVVRREYLPHRAHGIQARRQSDEFPAPQGTSAATLAQACDF